MYDVTVRVTSCCRLKPRDLVRSLRNSGVAQFPIVFVDVLVFANVVLTLYMETESL